MSFSQPEVLEDLLTYRVNRLMASAGALGTRLCEGRYGITRREWRLICLLAERGPIPSSTLAQMAHLERALVSRNIRDLLDKRLLVKRPVQRGTHHALLELTARGQRIHDELFPQSAQFHCQMLSALTPEQRTSLDAALFRLTEAADRLLAAQPPTDKADRRRGGSRRIPQGEGNLPSFG